MTRSDPRWYETLGNDPDVDGALFPEEAWRDPWVHEDPSGGLWHMLVTARSTEGALDDRGVIGHATSTDLERWEVQPPLTSPGSGFVHLEVPQVVQVDGAWFLVFSCPADALSTANPRADETPGTWSVPIDGPFGPFDVTDAEPLTDVTCYSGRIVRRRDGSPVLMTFANGRAGEPLPGFLHDPVDVHVVDGRLALRPATRPRPPDPDPDPDPTLPRRQRYGRSLSAVPPTDTRSHSRRTMPHHRPSSAGQERSSPSPRSPLLPHRLLLRLQAPAVLLAAGPAASSSGATKARTPRSRPSRTPSRASTRRRRR